MNRYTRQIRLRDVGPEGQARLEAASVALTSTGFAREIEEIYLRSAGVGVETRVGGAQPADVGLGLRHPAAREVADGALAALVAIRAALRGGGA
jgi:hypothetical protein